MAGTNAVAFKQALIEKIAAIPAIQTMGIQVAYSWPGPTFERECVHGGRVEGQGEYATFAGGRARLPRDETLTVFLYVVVRMPGGDAYDVETRACQIGQEIENGIAAAPQFDTVAGMLWATITGVQLDSDADDDAWSAVLEYQIAVRSRLN